MRVIEVFADVTCPSTHVGLRRLAAERDARQRGDVRLVVRAWPLGLVNDPARDARFVASEIAALRATVAPHLFSGFNPARFPSTSLPALALAATAYTSSAALGESVSLALRDALFEQGRDLTDRQVLVDIAEFHGVTPTAAAGHAGSVAADLDEARRRGVTGSPYFFVDGTGFFRPMLDIAHVDGESRVSVDEGHLRDFLQHCFR